MKFQTKNYSYSGCLTKAACFASLSVLPLTGVNAQIVLNANDGGGVSSFNSGVNWDGGLAPSPGNDYVNNAFGRRLRSPNSAGDYVFAGDSLTISNQGQFFLKATGTVTVNDLRLDGGRIYYSADTNGTTTVAGNITLQAGGGLFGTTNHEIVPTQNLNISANIGGIGQLWATIDEQLADFGVGPVKVTLSGNNTYSGGTRVGGGSSAPNPGTRNYDLGGYELIVGSSLGTGDVTVEGHSVISYALNLQSATAIDAGASLIISETPAITLGFTGSNSISGLSFDGGSTWAAPGIYGAGTHPALFSGTGTLTVVPEASAVSMIAGLLVFGFVWMRSRSKKI